MLIHAAYVGFDIKPEIYNYLLHIVDEQSKNRINKFTHSIDATRTLVSNALMRSIIIKNYQINNSEIAFDINEYGKPFLRNNTEIHFNISHSGDWVVCAIDDDEIGIDIEKISEVDYKIVERFFSAGENLELQLRRGREKLEYFFDLWTLKESYIKAWGKGLSVPLDSFDIRICQNGEISLLTQNELRECFFKKYDIDSRYKMSVCSMKDTFPKEVILMEIDEIMQLL